MTRLELTSLVAGYGSARVIHGLDLTVAPGEVVALLGRNGMGKTTLLRTIAGQLTPVSGRRFLDGAPLGRAERTARAGVAIVPDDRGVFPTLTVAENLRLARRRDYAPPVDVAEIFPVVTERMDVAAGDLSGGQKQQLALARAICAGSKLLLLDEISQGLQPSLTTAVLEAIRVLSANGVATILVDQSPEMPLTHCDRILGLEKGAIVLDEQAAVLREDSTRLSSLLVV